jgi:hypothetical protein
VTQWTITVEVREKDFVAQVGDTRIVLPSNRLARGLNDIALLVAAASGIMTPGLQTHLTEHFGPDQAPSGKCEFCKLQGRILAAEGRRRLSDREDRARAIPPTTLVREGLTGSAISDALKRAEIREAERVRRLPKLGGKAPRKGDTTDVWF